MNLNISETDQQQLLQVFPEGVVFFDVETTGLSPVVDHLVEIGAIKWEPQKEITFFSTLIKPPIPMPKDVIAIHGIDDSMVAQAPTLSAVLKDFMPFCGKSSLVAHNAQFDLGFLVAALRLENQKLPDNNVYDSCRLAKWTFKQRKEKKPVDLKLSTLGKFFKLVDVRYHRAMADAQICFQVTVELLKLSYTENMKAKEHSFLFQISDFDSLDKFSMPDSLLGLVELVRQREFLEIKYEGGSRRGEFRPVWPNALLPLPQGLMLQALCLLSNQYKSFSLKKISDFRKAKPEQIEHWKKDPKLKLS